MLLLLPAKGGAGNRELVKKVFATGQKTLGPPLISRDSEKEVDGNVARTRKKICSSVTSVISFKFCAYFFAQNARWEDEKLIFFLCFRSFRPFDQITKSKIHFFFLNFIFLPHPRRSVFSYQTESYYHFFLTNQNNHFRGENVSLQVNWN